MLGIRCQAFFNDYVHKAYQKVSPDMVDKLNAAFEAGAFAAKRHGDASLCKFSALTNPDEFLAWVEGYKCCDHKER